MVRTQVFRVLQIGALALLVLAFAIGAAGAQPAQAANLTDTQTSDGWLPFTGSLFDFQTNSIINFNGRVHIITRWKAISASQGRTRGAP